MERQQKPLTETGDGIPGVAKTPEEFMVFLDELVAEAKEIGYTPKFKWITARKI